MLRRRSPPASASAGPLSTETLRHARSSKTVGAAPTPPPSPDWPLRSQLSKLPSKPSPHECATTKNNDGCSGCCGARTVTSRRFGPQNHLPPTAVHAGPERVTAPIQPEPPARLSGLGRSPLNWCRRTGDQPRCPACQTRPPLDHYEALAEGGSAVGPDMIASIDNGVHANCGPLDFPT